MTIEEFNKTEFRAGDMFKYNGELHLVASVNFYEGLVAYDAAEADDDMFLVWLRCESIEEYIPYIKEERP